MIKSMTGYGKSNLSKNLREYQIEIKSVNHRYLDVSIKMPKSLSYLEEEIKRIVSSNVSRGKIDVFVTFKNKYRNSKNVYKRVKKFSRIRRSYIRYTSNRNF